MMYYNTTNEVGEKLTRYKKKARTQDDVIYEVFEKLGNATQHEVWMFLYNRGTDYPPSSICRAVNTLTCLGKVVKTSDTRVGRYGKLIYVWRINER